jgi:hypothetical protein
MTYLPKSELVGVLSPSAINTNDIGVKWSDITTNAVIDNIRTICHLENGIAVFGGASGEIWRSTDYGNNWINLGVIVGAIQIRNICYLGNGIAVLGTDGGHEWRSTNFGLTWTDIGDIHGAGRPLSSFSYFGNGIVIVTTEGSLATNGIIRRSTDFGLTWATVQSDANVVYKSSEYLENGTALAGRVDGHVFRSNNFGANWADLGLITGGGILSISYLGNGVVIFVTNNDHVWRSVNYGVSWVDVNPAGFGSIIISSVYLGNGITVFGTFSGHIWRSINFGFSWSDLGVIGTAGVLFVISYLSNGVVMAGGQFSGFPSKKLSRSDVAYKIDEAQVNYPKIPVDMTLSRAFDTTYSNLDTTRSLMISVYGAFLMTALGGTAEIQAVADTNVLPITPISDNVGIVGGLNGQSNRIPLYAFVKPGFNYRVDSSVLNGTATLLSWYETYI